MRKKYKQIWVSDEFHIELKKGALESGMSVVDFSDEISKDLKDWSGKIKGRKFLNKKLW